MTILKRIDLYVLVFAFLLLFGPGLARAAGQVEPEIRIARLQYSGGGD